MAKSYDLMNKTQVTSLAPSELHPYAGLLKELEDLQSDLRGFEQTPAVSLQDIDPLHLASSINLIHYLGLRRRDVRSLQERLAAVGLSSLGRMESHVFANLNAMIDLLRCALGKNSGPVQHSLKSIPIIYLANPPPIAESAS